MIVIVVVDVYEPCNIPTIVSFVSVSLSIAPSTRTPTMTFPLPSGPHKPPLQLKSHHLHKAISLESDESCLYSCTVTCNKWRKKYIHKIYCKEIYRASMPTVCWFRLCLPSTIPRVVSLFISYFLFITSLFVSSHLVTHTFQWLNEWWEYGVTCFTWIVWKYNKLPDQSLFCFHSSPPYMH